MSALETGQRAFRDFLKRYVELSEIRTQTPDVGAYGGGNDDDDFDGFAEEYARLKEESSRFGSDGAFTSFDGKLECNRKKNRYKDIVPYDSSRVRLQELDGVNGSDYINASFIKGVSRPQEYIAAQGPIGHTLTDFWRMIVEQKVIVIVMVAIDKEGHKVKCEKYWPELGEEKTFGSITVNLIREEWHNNYYVERLLHIKWQQPSRNGSSDVDGARQVPQSFPAERHIVQYHYVAWPDHGIPSPNASISHFMVLVRQREREMHETSLGAGDSGPVPPLLVHCSAGCGRTGTVIAIDYVQQLLANYERTGSAGEFRNFSLYDLVLNLRKQRNGMIQTKDQYSIVYQAVADLFREVLAGIAGSSSASQGRNATPAASVSSALDEMDELLAGLNQLQPARGSAGQQAPAVPPKSSASAAALIGSRPSPSRQLEEWPPSSTLRDGDDDVQPRPLLPRKISPEVARFVAQPLLAAGASAVEKQSRGAAVAEAAPRADTSERPLRSLQPTAKPLPQSKSGCASSSTREQPYDDHVLIPASSTSTREQPYDDHVLIPASSTSTRQQPYDDHVLIPASSAVGRSAGRDAAADVAEAAVHQSHRLQNKYLRAGDPVVAQRRPPAANAAAERGIRISDSGEGVSVRSGEPAASPASVRHKGRDASAVSPPAGDAILGDKLDRVRTPPTAAGHAGEPSVNVLAAVRASEKLGAVGLNRSMTLQPRASAPPRSSRQTPAAAAAHRTPAQASSGPGPADQSLAASLAHAAAKMRSGGLASPAASRQPDLSTGVASSAHPAASPRAADAGPSSSKDRGSNSKGGGDSSVYMELELPQSTAPTARLDGADVQASAAVPSQRSAAPGCRPLPALPDVPNSDGRPPPAQQSPLCSPRSSTRRSTTAEDGQPASCGDYVYVDLNATNKWPLQHIALGLPADPSVVRLSSPYSVANDDSCSSAADASSPPAVPPKSAGAYHYADNGCDDGTNAQRRDSDEAEVGDTEATVSALFGEDTPSKPKHPFLSSKAGDFLSGKMKTLLQTTKKTITSEPSSASGYLKEDVVYHGVKISFPNRVSKPKGVQSMPRQWKLSSEDSVPFPRGS